MTRSDRRRRPATLLVPTLLLGLVGLVAGAPAQASPAVSETPQMLVVLDSSGSMAEADAGGGQTRMEAAKQAVVALAAGAPASARIGLRTYGDGVDSQAPGSCEDTSLKVPVGPVDRAAITSAVQALAPRGDTPIGTSLRAAAGDLGGTGPRSIVLVSDGEPTCDPDPCVVAQELAAQGVDLRIDVVGFRVGEEARAVLRCVADAGRGQYVDAADAGELTAALGTSARSSFRAYVPEGTPVTGAASAEGAPVLEEGQYLDAIAVGAPRYYRVDLERGETLRVGATLTRGDDGSRRGLEGFVDMSTFGADGERCTRQFIPGGGQQGTAPRTGGVLHGPGSWSESLDASCGSGPVTLEVSWTNASDTGALPMELVVRVEPPVLTPPPLQPAVTEAISYPEPPRAAGPAVPVAGGGSFNAATELSPGLHSDSMRSGETVYYRVPLEWGQQLAVRVDFPASPVGSPVRDDLGSSTYAHLGLNAASRTPVASVSDAQNRSKNVARDGATVHATTHPVAYEGRQERVYYEQWGMSEAGDVYVVLSLGRTASTDAGSGVAVPFEVSVDVVGEPLQGPVYAGASATASTPGASAEPSPLPSAATVVSAAPSAPPGQAVAAASGREGDGWRPLTTALALLAGVLVTALLGLVAWGVASTRRRPAPGSGPGTGR